MTTAARTWLLPTLRDYQRAWLSKDVIAGLSAGAVVIPQAMAYATIADLPVQVGLYTCIVPMTVYALLGGSRAMSVSTTSTIATLTASTLVTAGVTAASPDPLGTVVALTLMVGLILLVLRLLRLGSLVENISVATILGVQVGVGATVAVGQLPKLLGVDAEHSGEGFIRSILSVIDALPGAQPTTVLLSAGSILAMLLLKRFARAVPAALVVVAAGILLVAIGALPGVTLIDAVPQGLPIPRLPSLENVVAIIPGALGIAVMVFLESVAVARGMRERGDAPTRSNQELLAVSTANVVGSFFVTLPAAGGFSQSAVNKNAGARSQLAALVTVALAVVVALFLGPVLSLLPQATLAALVFVAVIGLVRVRGLVRLAKISPIDFWVSLVVALLGLSAGLLAAVAAGVVITLVLVLRELNTPRLDVLGRVGGVLSLYVARGLYTANMLAYERAIVETVEAGNEGTAEPVHALVLDLSQAVAMTITVLDGLTDLEHDLRARGVTLYLARLPAAAATVADRLPWYQGLREAGRVFDSVDEAVAAARAAASEVGGDRGGSQ